MTIVVQVSDFRNNMAKYLDMVANDYEIGIKRGRRIEAKLVACGKKKPINMAENILRDMDEIRAKIKIRSKVKTMEELNNEIDRIVYGVDRNGKELSETDRQ